MEDKSLSIKIVDQNIQNKHIKVNSRKVVVLATLIILAACVTYFLIINATKAEATNQTLVKPEVLSKSSSVLSDSDPCHLNGLSANSREARSNLISLTKERIKHICDLKRDCFKAQDVGGALVDAGLFDLECISELEGVDLNIARRKAQNDYPTSLRLGYEPQRFNYKGDVMEGWKNPDYSRDINNDTQEAIEVTNDQFCQTEQTIGDGTSPYVEPSDYFGLMDKSIKKHYTWLFDYLLTKKSMESIQKCLLQQQKFIEWNKRNSISCQDTIRIFYEEAGVVSGL